MEATTNFATQMPWIILTALLGIGVFIMARRLKGMQIELTTARSDVERLSQSKAVLETQLVARDAELARERSANEARIAELTTERNAARQLGDDARAKLGNVETEVARLTTRVQEIATLTAERNEARKQADDARNERNSLDNEVARLKTRLAEITTLTTERDQARAQLEDLRRQHSAQETELATISTRASEEHKAAEDKLRLLEQAEQRLNKEFENLANRIFEEKHQKFNEVSKTGVEALLNPVRQQLSDFKKKVEDVYEKEARDRTSLQVEINNLKSLNERISTDAINLTKALKGDSKVRGNWGEIQLERLLEQSGLTKGREYEIQASLKSEEGQRFRPDVIVHLPDRKDVVIPLCQPSCRLC